jgi:hypothetical protein
LLVASFPTSTAILNRAARLGYQTEKIIDPKRVDSIAIYVGDPLARNDFDPAGYVDITSFRNLREMVEFVRALDCDRKLYINTLSAPHYRSNALPRFARQEPILAFFDRIFIAATEGRRDRPVAFR